MRVLLDVFAVLVERGRADTGVRRGRLGLEHVGGIGCLGGPGTNQRVQLVDEQDDLPVAGGDLLDEGLEAILEFPAVLRAGDHGLRSIAMSVLFLSDSGTSPLTMRRASPSAIAVLPTPGSPISTGLFVRD